MFSILSIRCIKGLSSEMIWTDSREGGVVILTDLFVFGASMLAAKRRAFCTVFSKVSLIASNGGIVACQNYSNLPQNEF